MITSSAPVVQRQLVGFRELFIELHPVEELGHVVEPVGLDVLPHVGEPPELGRGRHQCLVRLALLLRARLVILARESQVVLETSHQTLHLPLQPTLMNSL